MFKATAHSNQESALRPMAQAVQPVPREVFDNLRQRYRGNALSMESERA